jgi:hypothetical protein
MDAVTIALPWADLWQVAMPDIVLDIGQGKAGFLPFLVK